MFHHLLRRSAMSHGAAFHCRRASTAATAEKMIKIPLNLYSLDGRYATALYTAALKSGGPAQLDAISKDLTILSAYIGKTPKAREFLNDPTLNRMEKKSAVLSWVPKVLASKSAPSLIINFLGLLAENGRLGELSKIVAAFEELMRAHRKEIPVTIMTALEMDADFAKKLYEKIMKQFIPADRNPVITTKVDPAILGGLIIHIDDKTIDLSVASKVGRINKALDQAL